MKSNAVKHLTNQRTIMTDIVIIARYDFGHPEYDSVNISVDGSVSLIIKKGFKTYEEALNYINDNELINCEPSQWNYR